MKDRFADQRVMPWQAAAQFGLQRVDALAPSRSSLALAQHVRMAGLVLRFGFGEVNRVRRAHQKVWRIERRQAIVLDVAQMHEVMSILADFAERGYPGIPQRPLDECMLQAAAAAGIRQAWIDALR